MGVRDECNDRNKQVVCSLPSGIGGALVDILGKHMARMQEGWFFDETINNYMWLLQEREDKRCGEAEVQAEAAAVAAAVAAAAAEEREEEREGKKSPAAPPSSSSSKRKPTFFFSSFFFEKMFPRDR